MMPDELTAALKRKDFETAAGIARAIGKQALLDLETAPTAKARAEIYQNSIAIVNDALYLARVLRAHIASELHANSVSFLYADTDLEQHHWRIQA
jgi:hypothetical protein